MSQGRRRTISLGLVTLALGYGCGSSGKPPTSPAAGAASAVDLATEDLPPGAALRFGTNRLRWHGVPEQLLFTPDGAKLVGISLDSYVRVWDAKDGRRLLRLGTPDPTGHVLAGAVSPDSRLVAVGGYGPAVHLWDLASGVEVHVIDGLPTPRRLEFSTDGHLLAVASEGQLDVFDTRSWVVTQHIAYGHDLTPVGFRFLADGRLIGPTPNREIGDLLADDPRGVRPIDLPDDAGPATIAHDGAFFVVGGDDMSLAVYDIATGARRTTLPRPAPTRGPPGWARLELAPDDRSVLATGGMLGAWIVPLDGRPPRQLAPRSAFAVGWAADGAVIAADSVGPAVTLWRAADGARLDQFAAHDHELLDLAASANGAVVATASVDGTVRLWDARSGTATRAIDVADQMPYAVALSDDGARVYVGTDRGAVAAYRVADGHRVAEVTVADGYVENLGVHGEVLAVATSAEATFLDVETLAPRRGQGYFIGFSLSAGAIAPDGHAIATTDGAELVVFDRDTGRTSRDARPLPAFTNVLAWSPADQLVVNHDDGALELVPVAGGAPVRTMQQPAPVTDLGLRAAVCAAFSPDGAVLATGGYDGAITLWEVASGTIVRTLTGHEDAVISLEFAPDGRRLYSASRDSTALAWDLASVAR